MTIPNYVGFDQQQQQRLLFCLKLTRSKNENWGLGMDTYSQHFEFSYLIYTMLENNMLNVLKVSFNLQWVQQILRKSNNVLYARMIIVGVFAMTKWKRPNLYKVWDYLCYKVKYVTKILYNFELCKVHYA